MISNRISQFDNFYTCRSLFCSLSTLHLLLFISVPIIFCDYHRLSAILQVRYLQFCCNFDEFTVAGLQFTVYEYQNLTRWLPSTANCKP